MYYTFATLIFVCIFCTGLNAQSTAQQACSQLAPGSPFYHYCSCGNTFAVDKAYQICLATDPHKVPCLINSYFQLCSAQLALSATCPDLPIHPIDCISTVVVSLTNPIPSPCDDINITLQAYDVNGNKQTYGGAFYTVNGEAARDNGDGTYTAAFPPNAPKCSSTADTPIPVSVICLGIEIVYVPQPILEQCPTGHCVPDPHWKGFFTGYFDYHGVGDFYLAQSGGTSTQVRTGSGCVGNPGITCPEAFAIRFADETNYELYAGYTAKLNHHSVPVPAIGQSLALGLYGRIERPSQYLYNIYAPEFLIQIQEITALTEIISIYNIVLYGCRPKVGLLAEHGRGGQIWGASGALAKPFGDSWLVQEECESLFTYNNTDPDNSYTGVNQPNAPQDYDGCDDTTGFADQVRAACAILETGSSLATQCAQYGVDSSTFYGNCVNDGICSGDLSFVDTMISTFAQQCQYKGGNNVIDLPPSAPRCTAHGAGIGQTVKILTILQFNVSTADALGRTITKGGYASSIKAHGNPRISFPPCRDNNDGTYTFQYVLLDAATYALTVTVNGAPIDGTPAFFVAAE